MPWNHYYSKLENLLFKQVSAASLSVFRIFFGVICFFETRRLATEIDGNSLNDIVSFEVLFKYYFFEWVNLLPQHWLVAIIVMMKVAAVLIVIGFLYRIAILLYLLGYLYFFLVDMSHYNNHYYLLILFLGFMLVVDADKLFSIKNFFKRKKTYTIPNWQLVLFKFQVVWVYFCAGLVKLNYDWLSGWTMRTAIFKGADFADNPFFHSMFFVYFYSWSGLIFDLCIGFLLLFKRTRLLAIIAIISFHLINAQTLSIGIFPFLMIWVSILFFQPNWPIDLWNRIVNKKIDANIENTASKKVFTANKWIVGGIGVYFLVQLFLPVRHHFIKGNVDWTGEGVMFAWRMKSAGRSGMEGRYNIYLYDKITNNEIDASIRLSDRQRKFILYKPILVLQIRDHLLKKLGRDKEDVRMELDIVCSINSSVYAPLFYRHINICDYELRYLKHNQFITPYPSNKKIYTK
ncbi:MAG: HTTM domain-containing protein [Chitinophagales bacterium]